MLSSKARITSGCSTPTVPIVSASPLPPELKNLICAHRSFMNVGSVNKRNYDCKTVGASIQNRSTSKSSTIIGLEEVARRLLLLRRGLVSSSSRSSSIGGGARGFAALDAEHQQEAIEQSVDHLEAGGARVVKSTHMSLLTRPRLWSTIAYRTVVGCNVAGSSRQILVRNNSKQI